jgi:hypothetical protein
MAAMRPGIAFSVLSSGYRRREKVHDENGPLCPDRRPFEPTQIYPHHGHPSAAGVRVSVMAVTSWSGRVSLPADKRRYQRKDEGDREHQHNRDNDGRRREALETAQQHSRLPSYRLATAFV